MPSRTIRQEDHPGVTIVAENADQAVSALRAVGQGHLAVRRRGGGISMLPPRSRQTKLQLTGHRIYKTGITALEYAVRYA